MDYLNVSESVGQPVRKPSKIRKLLSSIATSRHLPYSLAFAAFLIMIPALFGGLFGDDLIQRLTQLKPDQLPPRTMETGLVSPRCGTFAGVVNDLFGYMKYPEQRQHAADFYVPWWASGNWQAALWRPVTAFTHWVDYQLFPNTPSLMHLENNILFAAIVFMVTLVYRQIGQGFETHAKGDGLSTMHVTALAALLFLLDKNSYFPLMYVANRGFFIALFFGLVSLWTHHRWRTTKLVSWCVVSVLSLFLAMLANEAGVSTMAFLIAYVLVLERRVARTVTLPTWKNAAFTLLPSASAVVVWRMIYVGQHCGVKNFEGYIDPGYAPLLFAKNLLPRMDGLLGGQLSGVTPEIFFVLSPGMRVALAAFFAVFIVVCAIVFVPTIRRDIVARYWAVVMLLAVVPAATVAPISKNLGFVSVGAFALIATFLLEVCEKKSSSVKRLFQIGLAVWLLLAHVVGASVARVGLAMVTPALEPAMNWAFDHFPECGGRDVVIINEPGPAFLMEAIYRANQGGPLPMSVKTLAMGLTGLTVSRTDEQTLVATAKGGSLFSAPVLQPVHVVYAAKAGNDFLFGSLNCKKGDRVMRKGWTIEILDVTAEGEPKSVSFRFDSKLEAENRLWLKVYWKPGDVGYSPFMLPKVGETVDVPGPLGKR